MAYLAIIYSSRRPFKEMDDGLLPTGNRRTRHLTTFYSFPDSMMYVSLEPHTHLYRYIYVYVHICMHTHTDFRLSTLILFITKGSFDIECHHMIILLFVFTLPLVFLYIIFSPSSSFTMNDFLLGQYE